MSLLVNVQPLRKHGVRLDVPPPVSDGYFRVEKRQGYTALLLISHKGGITMLGPLFEPRITRSEPDGFVLLGFETGEGKASFVQEWLVSSYTGTFMAPRVILSGERTFQ